MLNPKFPRLWRGLVDRIVGPDRLLTLSVSLPLSSASAGLGASWKMTRIVSSPHVTPVFPHELLGRLITFMRVSPSGFAGWYVRSGERHGMQPRSGCIV